VKIFWGLLIVLVLHASTDAADKIRIAYPNLNAAIVAIPLAHKREFLNEEALEAEFVRVSGAAAMAPLVNGEVYYYAAITPAVLAAIQGLLVRVAACFMIAAPQSLGLGLDRSTSLRENRLR
jgi:hypothetical protein